VTVIGFGSGKWAWARQGGGNFGDSGNGVAVDSKGNVLVTGSFSNKMDFPNGNPSLISIPVATQVSVTAIFLSPGMMRWASYFGLSARVVSIVMRAWASLRTTRATLTLRAVSPALARFYSFGSSTVAAILTAIPSGYNKRVSSSLSIVPRYMPLGAQGWRHRR
jgi:hypothetical protein